MRRLTLNHLSIVCLLAVSSACQLNRKTAVTVDDQIVEAYTDFLDSSVMPGDSKLNELDRRLGRLTDTGTAAYPHILKLAEIPELVAMRAVHFELGVIVEPNRVEARALAQYSDLARRTWSPMARRLWLEATYKITDHLPTIRKEVDNLKRERIDTVALEGAVVTHDQYNPKLILALTEKQLAFAESHPKDIGSAKGAALRLYLSIVTAKKGEAVRYDLVDRAYALEARTLENQNTLLNDNQRSLKVFDVLRKFVPKKP